MASLRLALRPEFRLLGAGAPVRLREREGLILLALAFNGESTKAELLEVLWPDYDALPLTWRNSMRVSIKGLRDKLIPFGWTIACRAPCCGAYGWRLKIITPAPPGGA